MEKTMKIRGTLIAVATLLSAVVPVGMAQNRCSNHQSKQEIDARIDKLIAQMTVAEKVAQLQDVAPAIPRLNLSAYNWWSEGLHGLARDGYATVFPQAIGLAATWDASLLQQVGDTVSTEARAKFNEHGRTDTPRYGGLTIWSPNINIFRDPRWGRGQETYGEDPFLTGTLGVQFVKGVQGDDPFYIKADATPKHFAAHSGPEEGRDGFNSQVPLHDLADTYLRAFHALTTTGGAAALMCSYNAINGTPSCANDLLDKTLRKSWSYTGYVVSDCDAVGNIATYHHYTKDQPHGAAAALNAGVDLDCGKTYAALQQSFDQKLVTEATIDRSLHRLLFARVKLGMLDESGCSPYDRISEADNDTQDHRKLALQAAEESAVLLRNDGVLPLRPASQSIAVIGPTADALKVLEANYHGTASQPVTPLAGLREAFPTVHYAQGSLLAAGVSSPIPPTALRTGPGNDAKAGLTAEYFAESSFAGKPAVTKTVDKVDLDLDRVAPDKALSANHYAARWSGYLVPTAPGDYVLHVNVERCWDCKTHDSFQLFVDGKLTINNSSGAKAEPNRTTIHFNDTTPHAIRLELLRTGEDEGISLDWEPPAQALLDEAVAVAQKFDVIVAFVGLSPDLEGEALQLHLDGFAGGDRVSLGLPASQKELLSRLQELHKPLIVVLTSGSAVALGPEQEKAAAVLAAWYPGEEGGHALANLLSGKADFSGRLPVTFYKSAEDLPAFSDYRMEHRTYRYFDGPVLYPFGFGLSYAKFSYDAVQLSNSKITAGEPLTATVTLHNQSNTAGTEVAELYVAPPKLAGAPHLALAGIQRVHLQAGEKREVKFTLQPDQLGFADPAGRRSVHPGSYRLFIGGAQPHLDQDKGIEFQITGDKPLAF
jgi:beta-glucosidase